MISGTKLCKSIKNINSLFINRTGVSASIVSNYKKSQKCIQLMESISNNDSDKFKSELKKINCTQHDKYYLENILNERISRFKQEKSTHFKESLLIPSINFGFGVGSLFVACALKFIPSALLGWYIIHDSNLALDVQDKMRHMIANKIKVHNEMLELLKK